MLVAVAGYQYAHITLHVLLGLVAMRDVTVADQVADKHTNIQTRIANY